MHFFRRWSSWSLQAKIFGISISAILLFLGGAIITGIVGNLATTFFLSLLNLIVKYSDLWQWIIIILLFIICVIMTFRNRIAHRALDTFDKIVRSDNTLLTLLPNLISTNDLDKALFKILEDLLAAGCRIFGDDVHRAAIFLPENSDILKIRVHYQMPDNTVSRTECYIGPDTTRQRGVAGSAFVKKETIVTHRITDNGKAKFDCTSYINFDLNREIPPYRSFACTPIFGTTASQRGTHAVPCLGVVCFDSHNPNTFDTSAAKELLRMFSTHIGTVLLMHDQHKQSHTQSP